MTYIDGKPYFFWKQEACAQKREEMRVAFQVIRDQPVEHYKVPNRQAWVHTIEGERTGIVKLDDDVWNQEIRKDLVHRVVKYHRDRMRQGTHKEKNRGEVRGGGRKPFPQKGQGRARQGSIRSPLNKGGGQALARLPQDYSFKLPAKVLSRSLQICLTSKFLEGNVLVIEDTDFDTYKTKALIDILHNKWKIYDKENDKWRTVAIITGINELDPNLALAARNLKFVDFFPSSYANTWDILRRDIVVLTRKGLEELQTRLKFPYNHPRMRINFLEGAPEMPAQGHLPPVVPVITKRDVQRLNPWTAKRVDHARPWMAEGYANKKERTRLKFRDYELKLAEEERKVLEEYEAQQAGTAESAAAL